MEKKDYKNYFLGLMSAEDAATLELQIISNDKAEAELLQTEENLIEDYLDKNLTNEETQAFNANFLVTKERRERVEFIKLIRGFAQNPATPATTVKEIEPGIVERIKSFLNPRKFAVGFGGFALLLTIGFVSYLGWKNLPSNSGQSEISVLLNKSFKNDRPTEARISGFDYAPKIEGTRGNNDKTQDLNIVSAKSRATEAVLKNETAENLHALGRVYLAEKNFDEAIKLFEKALKKNPDIAQLHNDLGVALLEKARLKDDGKLENLAKANEEFAKTIELDKSLLEAYFNQALCLQALNLPNQAREAWQNYLNLDSNSKWADEARKNLETLESQRPISKTKEEILQEFLQAKQTGDHEKAWQTLSRNREMITGKLIPQQLAFLFVESKTKGDEAKANEALDALIYAGKLEEEKSGDLYWKYIARYYSQKRDYSDLHTAQHLVFKSYELARKNEYQQALKNFGMASKIFQKNDNIWEAQICEYWRGTLLYRLHKINRSTEAYKGIARFSAENDFKWLASQSYTKLSLNAGIGLLDKYSKAIEYDEKALKFAEETQDLYGLQKIPSQIAYEYKQVGRYSLSLKYCEKSLKIAALPEASRRETYRTYYFISDTLFKMKFYDVSAQYQKEALALASELNDKTFLHITNLYLGMIRFSQENYDEAQKFLEESIVIANSFPDQEEKEKALAYSKLELGNLKKQMGKYDEAKDFYRNALSFYDSSEYKLNRYETHKGYLLSLLKTQDNAEIAQEFSILFDLFRNYRTEIIEDQNRESFFDNEQTIYDLAIDYENSRGNYEKAFNYSEESRSRTLLDLLKQETKISDKKLEVKLSSNIFEPVGISEIRSQMPDSAQIIEYAVLPDRVIIWLISKEEFQTFSSQISAEELQDKINSYSQIVSQNQLRPDEENRLATELYKILIEPINGKLDKRKQLCIIPDKSLFNLSFASLISTQTGQYFVAEQSFVLSPSANVFLLSSKKSKELKSISKESLLSIGNPSFDAEQFPDLPNLISAEDEARSISQAYQKNVCLIGNKATKAEIVKNFKNANVVHFAGHYLVNEGLPLLSGFILAGRNDKTDSLLANYEIIGEKFSKTRLVVLSACQTGIEKYYQGEGMVGAARTFLATGIPLVVGSQWAVDSEATSELMEKFHFYRKNKQLSTVEALRQAQLEMLNGNNEKFKQPYYWASFVSMGGYAEF